MKRQTRAKTFADILNGLKSRMFNQNAEPSTQNKGPLAKNSEPKNGPRSNPGPVHFDA